ncbi:MAG: ABC transporter permease [Planctomycetota bacterium]|nr:ABC transporter permease [Planctomycetota bacterium]
MTRFLLRRLAWAIVTILAVATLSFVLMRSVRGGPFDSERRASAAVEQNLRERYHLDWPLWKQFAAYIGPFELGAHGPELLGGDGTDTFGGVLAGDLGPSLMYRDASVNDILAQSLPISAALGFLALSWALVVGVGAGIVSALKRGTRVDVALRLAATTGIALPNFAIAGFLVLLFAFVWPILPVAGHGSLRHLVLPSLALGAPFAAYIARLTRSGMLESLGHDCIRTARAKGLPERLVVMRHALRGGILPVVSYLGPAAAGVLTGSLVIERIFAIPGTGSHFVNSALNRDYTLAMGVTILYTALVCGLNLLVDVVYAALDPRIALEDES